MSADDTVVNVPASATEQAPLPPTKHLHPAGTIGQLQEAFFGPASTRQRERAEKLADIAVTDAAERSRHLAQLGHEELKQARARTLERRATAWLIILIGAELLCLVPLLVWGLFTGEVW